MTQPPQEPSPHIDARLNPAHHPGYGATDDTTPLPLLTHPQPEQHRPPSPPDQPRPPNPWKRRRGVAAIAAVILAAGAVGGVTGVVSANAGGAGTNAPPSSESTAGSQKLDVRGIAGKVLPSVVEVNAAQSLGSGVIVSEDGQILTNNHVVSDAAQNGLTVTLNDGRKLNARVVATDPEHDLALLQAEGASDLPAATLADSDSVRVGDQVLAVGSPGGLQGTVTSGVVSALDREISAENGPQTPFQRSAGQQSYRAIQTDAALNDGNSGGPLFNSDGEVVGINFLNYSPSSTPGQSSGSVGLGFAIPSNDARQFLDQVDTEG